MAPPTLNAIILSNEHAFNNRPTYKRLQFGNLTLGEWGALSDLKQNEDIVIKSTNRGNAACVLQYEDYISEGLRKLTDSKFYQPVDTDLTEKQRK